MSGKVIIRADGGKSIGMGHLARAILISDYLLANYGAEVLLIIKKDDMAEKFLENKPINVKIIPQNVDIHEESEIIIKNIINEDCCLFILDDLINDINSDFTNKILNTKVPFAAITDDSFKRVINADVIINGNPCQTGIDYSNEIGKYYVGPSFFIMDNNYSLIRCDEPPRNIKNVLLTVGGSDHNNIIFDILDAIEKLNVNFNLTLITSKGTGYLNKLKERIKNYKRQIKILIDIPGIVKEIEKCDFAITAGGNTLFERIAARRPGVTICQLQRQMEIADKFTELGVNYNLGFGPELTTKDIFVKLNEYLKRKEYHLTQYNNARKYVDGKGLDRVAKILINLIKNK